MFFLLHGPCSYTFQVLIMLSQFLRRHARVFMPVCSANTELSMFAVGRYCAERSIVWCCTNSGGSLVVLSAAGREIFFLTSWRAGFTDANPRSRTSQQPPHWWAEQGRCGRAPCRRLQDPFGAWSRRHEPGSTDYWSVRLNGSSVHPRRLSRSRASVEC